MRSVAIGLWILAAGCSEPRVSAALGEARTIICQFNEDGTPVDPCCAGSPLLIELGDGDFGLTSASGGVFFDLSGDGEVERVAWTRPGGTAGWLALDADGDGKIDSGRDLFGNYSARELGAAANGFGALALYDSPGQGGNLDGKIDRFDAVWPRLRLWVDDGDATAATSELLTLDRAGVTSIGLAFTISDRTDEHGNRFSYQAAVTGEAHVNPVIYDVYLTRARLSQGRGPVGGASTQSQHLEWYCIATCAAYQPAPEFDCDRCLDDEEDCRDDCFEADSTTEEREACTARCEYLREDCEEVLCYGYARCVNQHTDYEGTARGHALDWNETQSRERAVDLCRDKVRTAPCTSRSYPDVRCSEYWVDDPPPPPPPPSGGCEGI